MRIENVFIIWYWADKTVKLFLGYKIKHCFENLISLHNLHKTGNEYYCTIAKSQMTIYFFNIISRLQQKGYSFYFVEKMLIIINYSGSHDKDQRYLRFSHSFCWCGKLAFDVIVRLFLMIKMCEYNQVQFEMLCPVYWTIMIYLLRILLNENFLYENCLKYFANFNDIFYNSHDKLINYLVYRH